MVSKIIASLYTVLALVALVLALAWVRQDALGFVFVVVLGLPWTFFLGKIVGDSPWLGPAFSVLALVLNAGLLWWWALWRARRAASAPAGR
jgi:hypothetical protein